MKEGKIVNPHKRILDFSLLGLSVLAWWFIREFILTIWDFFRLPIQENWPVSLPEILAFGIGLATFIILKRQKKVNEFGLEVINEFSKVTWPTQKETALSTVVIIIMVAIASVILFFFDVIWGTFTRSLMELNL